MELISETLESYIEENLRLVDGEDEVEAAEAYSTAAKKAYGNYAGEIYE